MGYRKQSIINGYFKKKGKIMENLLTTIEGLISFEYVLSQIMLSFIVLYFIVSKPNRKEKYICTLSIGLLLGIVWYFFINNDLKVLIVSFIFATFIYDWAIKHILNKLKIKYNDK